VALGGIPLAEYGTPGTDEFYQPVLKYLEDYDAFLLENHGALTIGHDVMSAYYKMETLEHFAHIAFTAIQLGGLNSLGEKDVQKLLDLRKGFGIRTKVSCESCARQQTEECAATSGGAASGGNGGTVDEDGLVESITRAIVSQLSAD
jgi:L-fuculose-phosphate aldolase